MIRIFKLVSILFLAVIILNGCLLHDYGIGRRNIEYKGIHNDAAKDGTTQYKTNKKKEWETEYTDGEYKTKKKGKWEEESIQGKMNTGDTEDTGEVDLAAKVSDEGNEKDEYCEPTYTLTPPRDYTGDACTSLCYQRQEKCKEDIRMKRKSCEHFNTMAQIEYGRCLASGTLHCYKSNHDCFAEVPDTTTQCEEEYRRCYESCGGTVTNSCDEN
ncbi:hypothetical protein GKODMF_07035 [Candidatus Electrothrix gigas]